MRRLLLLRHAKSSWDNGDLDDISRPLAPRGRRAAPLIGRHISARGYVPDLVLCSTAERTRQTLELVAAEWERDDAGRAKVEMHSSLYLASLRDLLAAVKRLNDDIESAMIIGHNPGMAVLAGRLAASGDPKALKTLAAKYPTAALAVIEVDVGSWKEMDLGTGHLTAFVRPKDLR